ncbi:MAG TPA: NADH-quinone oxidoreductase subunit N [Anaerolineae bacterium]
MKSSDLIYLLPEIILLLSAALVLVLDLTGPKDKPKAWLPYVALLGLGLAILGVVPSLGGTHQVATMLAVDPFAVFFKVLAILGVAVVVLTSMSYMEGRTPYRGEFYGFLLIVALAICLAVSATNLVMIYLSMEFLSITSYVLAGYIRNDQKSGEAAIKYFLYGATASATMLYGMSLLYGVAGTTDLAGLAKAFAGPAGSQLTWLGAPAIVLLIAGFGFKASLVPFHQWAPDTYEGAPTPVTAFLSTASKATGFAILMRVFLVAMGHSLLQTEWNTLLIALAILTMTIGNLTALRQSNIKRLLAYSSIAQAGYILMGMAAVALAPGRTFTGANGVLIYLFGYLFTNVGAFAVVMAVENASGKTDVKDYAGLITRSPWLAGVLFIFLVSLAGIPPTAGFLGKFFVFGAAVQRQLWVLAAVGAVNSVIAAFYYLNIVRYMFFTPAEEGAEPIAVAASLQGALIITGVLTLLIGLVPGPLIDWATTSALHLWGLP